MHTHILFTSYSMDRCIGWFYNLAIMNNAAANIDVQMLLW